mmetsp:Transcript_30504/g.68888  ORF Transcript_30504/g.68888 Transcript_30504/m.68888 type:complete len:92 (+) Transcript_30504:2338-2613(+)
MGILLWWTGSRSRLFQTRMWPPIVCTGTKYVLEQNSGRSMELLLDLWRSELEGNLVATSINMAQPGYNQLGVAQDDSTAADRSREGSCPGL